MYTLLLVVCTARLLRACIALDTVCALLTQCAAAYMYAYTETQAYY
jgi:hypothetical protein